MLEYAREYCAPYLPDGDNGEAVSFEVHQQEELRRLYGRQGGSGLPIGPTVSPTNTSVATNTPNPTNTSATANFLRNRLYATAYTTHTIYRRSESVPSPVPNLVEVPQNRESITPRVTPAGELRKKDATHNQRRSNGHKVSLYSYHFATLADKQYQAFWSWPPQELSLFWIGHIVE